MAKKAAKNLVIVESPAKAKTIGKYLGPDYEVMASMGHLRDLPKSKIGIDFENDFKPDYRAIRGKEDIIKSLKKAADKADMVYLATDPDREGEAISWHLKYLLDLDDAKTRRVTFNEITKKVVQESIAAPRRIDQDLVDAQQARRVLDRIVGYRLSPLLWKKIRRGLSAGRVQSVAMRLVAQREKEIETFVPQEYWTLDALLHKQGDKTLFKAHYYGKNGKKYEPASQAETQAICEDVMSRTFSVKSVKRADKQRSPSPPFTTSTLQQEASRKLNMTPRPLYRRLPHSRPGGKRHWPPLHLRPHGVHHPGPGVCGQGGQVSAHDPSGVRGQRPDVPALPQDRGCEVYRQYGKGAGRGGVRR